MQAFVSFFRALGPIRIVAMGVVTIVQFSADFDFSRITRTSDRFDPASRVVRSGQSRVEVGVTMNGSHQGRKELRDSQPCA